MLAFEHRLQTLIWLPSVFVLVYRSLILVAEQTGHVPLPLEGIFQRTLPLCVLGIAIHLPS